MARGAKLFASLRIAAMRAFHVYILASLSRTLYIGVTNDLVRRVYQHRNCLVPGFTSKYRVSRLVHFEELASAHAAIAREKQLKGWGREKKLRLIEQSNAGWDDLSSGWYAPPDSSLRSE